MPCHMQVLQNCPSLWKIIGCLQFSPRNFGEQSCGKRWIQRKVCFKQTRRCDDSSGQDRMRFLACPSPDPILYNLYCPISTPRSRIFYMRQQNRCHSLPKTFRVLKSLVIPKEVSPLPYAFPRKTSQCGSEFLIGNYECHIVATGEELESTSVVLFQWLAIVGYQQHTALRVAWY